MADEIEKKIPRYGHARVAFLGVEINDTYLLLASLFIGLFVGSKVGLIGYVGIPVTGYFLTKLWLDWKSDQLPGNFTKFLYQKGLMAYNDAFKSANVIYHGDAEIINKGMGEQIKQLQLNQTQEKSE